MPEQLRWPEPRYTHWSRLHEAVNEARARVGKAHAQIDAAERDANLSDEGKKHARAKIAEQAVADLQKSDALEKACTAVAHQMQTWAAKLGEHIKPAEDVHTAMLHSKILDRVAAMDTPARLTFLQKNGGDPLVASALLTAPAFISGLSKAEIAVVTSQLDKRVLSPEVIEARAATERALADAERGWQRALQVIDRVAVLIRSRSADRRPN